jgi:glycogen synthase
MAQRREERRMRDSVAGKVPAPVRLLVLSNMYPPHHYGGYELSCRDVMERFEARGHQVTVLTTTMRVPGVDDPPGERDAGVRRELDFYWRDHDLVSPPVWRRFLTERANQRALRRAITDVRPDVVSVWNMGAMSLGLVSTVIRRRVPLLYSVCDDWLHYGPRLDAWTRLWWPHRRWVGRAVSAVTGVPTVLPDLGASGTFCFVSERTRQFAERRTPWTFPVSTVVYSGIDRRDFPAVDRPRARPFGWRLLYVGRIDERKGIGTAVRALTDLPDEATLDLVGSGDESELARLRDLVAELGVGDRVHFDSRVVDRARLHERYAQADVFVFPSTWDEPFGLVPLEAMACATPVVATGRGGSAEFLEDGRNCVLFTAGDPCALAGAVRRLAEDEGLRRRVVEQGLVTADDLTVDRLADALEEWHLAAGMGGTPAHRPPPR